MNDHDLLTSVHTILKELKEQFTNHLKHHFIRELAAWGVALGAVSTLAFYILTQK